MTPKPRHEVWCYDDRELEVVRQGPRPSAGTLVFVHGVCHGAWCWQHFSEFFAEQGYDTVAFSLRGHAGSSGRRDLHRLGLDDYVDDLSRVVERLDRKPVIIGHSMGGAIVQRYLAAHADSVSAAVLFASATAGGLGGRRFIDVIRGIGPGALLNALRIVLGLSAPAERANNTPFFGRRLSEQDARHFALQMGPESRRAVRDLVTRFDALPPVLPPMLVIGSRDDDLFGVKSQQATARAYGVRPQLLDGLCHDMMLDPDWRRPANRVLEFLRGPRAV